MGDARHRRARCSRTRATPRWAASPARSRATPTAWSSELGPQKQALSRAILLRLVTPERTRAIVPLDELRELSREVGEVQRLVDQMVEARLLVVQTLEGGKGATVEIVHESLIHNWPTLRRWLDENQDDAAFVDQLRTAARQWNAKGRTPDLLWRGDTADEAKKFRKRYKGPLSDVERAFLDEVIALRAARSRAASASRHRRLHRPGRRSWSRRWSRS